MKQTLVVYVDVDDTLVRTVGNKQMPITGVADHVRKLHEEGAQLFCWSSGGADYAKSVAEKLNIAQYFSSFLPKPHALLDDQAISDWKRLIQVHPFQCSDKSVVDYWNEINGETAK